MIKKPISWHDKLHHAKPHQIKKIPKDFADLKAGQMMLLPTALMVNDYIKTIPFGHKKSMKMLRTDLAILYHADVTCPIVAGIHLKTVSELAYEHYMMGKDITDITPFWRVMDEKIPTLKKLSFSKDFVITRWREEIV